MAALDSKVPIILFPPYSRPVFFFFSPGWGQAGKKQMNRELTKRRRQCSGDVAEEFVWVSVGVSMPPVCPAPMLWERESGCLKSAVSSRLSGYGIKGRGKKKMRGFQSASLQEGQCQPQAASVPVILP